LVINCNDASGRKRIQPNATNAQALFTVCE
jgi:hypothetical protein